MQHCLRSFLAPLSLYPNFSWIDPGTPPHWWTQMASTVYSLERSLPPSGTGQTRELSLAPASASRQGFVPDTARITSNSLFPTPLTHSDLLDSRIHRDLHGRSACWRSLQHSLEEELRSGHSTEQPNITYCTLCNQVRPFGSHHCGMCGRCVLRMDHHCLHPTHIHTQFMSFSLFIFLQGPWVGNCVGAYNHKYFILFLFYTVIVATIYSVFTSFPVFGVVCPTSIIHSSFSFSSLILSHPFVSPVI